MGESVVGHMEKDQLTFMKNRLEQGDESWS